MFKSYFKTDFRFFLKNKPSVLLIFISFQAIKAVLTSPVRSLKAE